jgi:hypothetical protein
MEPKARKPHGPNMGEWEERWRDPQDLNQETVALTPQELFLAKRIWGHLRFLAGYREKGDPGKLLEMQDETPGNYLEDWRPVSPEHSIGWINIEHHGTYWEVSWGSKEFSSSFATRGRGRTLAEAMQAAEDNQ